MIILSIIYFFFPPNFLFNCQLWPTLCNPMDCSMVGLPAPHPLSEFAQVHVHCIALVMLSSHLILWCPLLLCPQSFPTSGTFPMSQLFASGDQNTGASVSASVLPVNIQGWFPLRLTSLISLLSRGLSGVFSSTTVQSHQFFGALHSLWSSSQNHLWPLGSLCCDPMDYSMPGFPVLHYLPELAQTHVHWAGGATQPSHPLSPSSPPSFNLCQHQGLFQWVNFL